MNRFLILLCVFGVGLLGCSGKATPPAPAPANSDNTPDVAPAAASAIAVSPTTKEQMPAASAPPPGDSRLHALAARLLESDGQGGWRKNEKAATELEKLSPDEGRPLLPLLKDPRAEVRRGAALFLLGVFDPNDSQQVSAFAWLLDDMDRMVRARALDAVKQCSHADQLATLPRLTALLDAMREDRADNR